MRVVLTRPQQDAGQWSGALGAAGHEVVHLPLLAIAALDDTTAVAQAWRQLHEYAAAMFVSGNAVQQFRRAAPDAPWPAATRAWGTGPGTLEALQSIGVPRGQIDTPPGTSPSFDSEALWSQVRGQVTAGSRVLIVRGADAQGLPAGRDWLATRLDGCGAQVQQLAVYRRTLPRWNPQDRAAAVAAAQDGSAWLFSSSEAVGNLARLLPGADWSRARAVATHDRIAQAARDAGFGVVCPSRPQVEAVLAALESIR